MIDRLPFAPPPDPIGLLGGLAVLMLLGDGLCRWLRLGEEGPDRVRLEPLGLRILLAMGAVPLFFVGLDLLRIPISRMSISIIALVIFGSGLLRRRPRRWPRSLRSLRPQSPGNIWILRSPAAAILLLASLVLLAASYVMIATWPPWAYDSVVGWNAVGKILAVEGKYRSTLFSVLNYNAQCVYPPWTAANQGFWYLFESAMPRLWAPLAITGFTFVLFGWIRRHTGSATAAALACFLTLTTPVLVEHYTNVAQTDLPSTIYVALAFMAGALRLRGRAGAGAGAIALWAFLSVTARSENVLFAGTLAGILWIADRGRPRAAAIVLGPSLLMFLFWNLFFVKALIGYDPGQYFRRTIDFDPARMAEVLSRAVKIIGMFGEVQWLVPLGLLLWVGGVFGRRRGWFDSGADPQLSGPFLLILGAAFLAYMPFFYQWNPDLNPLWTMEHTFKRGFLRFVPGLIVALVSAPPLLVLLRRCDGGDPDCSRSS